MPKTDEPVSSKPAAPPAEGRPVLAYKYETVFCVFLVILGFLWRGNPDQRVIMSGYLGLWLLSGGMIAVGVLMSSVTQYQLVAGVLTLGTLLGLWLSNVGTNLVDAFASQLRADCMVHDVVNNICRCVIDAPGFTHFRLFFNLHTVFGSETDDFT